MSDTVHVEKKKGSIQVIISAEENEQLAAFTYSKGVSMAQYAREAVLQKFEADMTDPVNVEKLATALRARGL